MEQRTGYVRLLLTKTSRKTHHVGVKNLEEILMDPWEGRTLLEQGDSSCGREGRNVKVEEGGGFSKVPKYFHLHRNLAILLKTPRKKRF